MKTVRRLVCLLTVFAVLILAVGCDSSDNFPKKPTERFYVNDFAECMTDSDEKEIMDRAVALKEATEAQVVVVTVKSLDGMEPVEYATKIGNDWGVGDKEKDNGIVILLSSGDREIFIAVGGGLGGALPDSKTGRIIDTYGLEYLQNDDFSTGLKEISKAVIGEVYLEYGLEAPDGYISIDYMAVKHNDTKMVIISWAAFIAIFVITMLFVRRRGGMPFIFMGPTFRGGGFGNSSGGGFSGFSGGGGSFGGGGAGRGF